MLNSSCEPSGTQSDRARVAIASLRGTKKSAKTSVVRMGSNCIKCNHALVFKARKSIWNEKDEDAL